VTRRICTFGIATIFAASIRICYSYITFFNYFSLNIALSNKKKGGGDDAVDHSDHPTDRCVGGSPYLIRGIKVFWKPKTLRERFHDKRIRPQFLKSFRSENNAVQESYRERGGGTNAT
jgi:hypothetical protein